MIRWATGSVCCPCLRRWTIDGDFLRWQPFWAVSNARIVCNPLQDAQNVRWRKSSNGPNWCRVCLEKLIVAQLVNRFPVLYGTQRLIVVVTRAHHWPLPRARLIHFSSTHYVFSRFIISVPSIPWSSKRPLCLGFVTRLYPVRAACFVKPLGFDLISILLKSIDAFQSESSYGFSLHHPLVPKTLPWISEAVSHACTAVSITGLCSQFLRISMFLHHAREDERYWTGW